jgi:uncharacterized membrane protein
MQLRLESAMRALRKIGLDEDKGYAVAILLALIIVSAIIAGYYLVLRPQAEPYNTMYLLDANKMAADYPVTVIANQNETFTVYVYVENHLASSASFQIQIKTTTYLSSFPVEVMPSQKTETGTISNNGKPVENAVTVTQNQLGHYWVVFELWEHKDNTLVFTENYCVLGINVIS